REIKIVKRANATSNNDTLLSVTNFCLKHPSRKNDLLLKNISFTLSKGEILGIFGLMGAGRSELMETIFGLHAKHATGNINIEGKEINIPSPADAIDAGLALVPEDRKKDG